MLAGSDSGGETPRAVRDVSAEVLQLESRLRNHISHDSLRAATQFRPRESDVFIASAPKTGTTLMQQLANGLRTHCDAQLFQQMREISDAVPWIEAAKDLGQDIDVDQCAQPRLFKTHFAYHAVPSGARYIYIVRDPLDTALSFYNFFNGWMFDRDSISLDTFVTEWWVDRGRHNSPASIRPTSYFRHIASWFPHRNDPNVLWLFYEDVLSDKRDSIERTARFMGIESSRITPKLVAEVERFTSIEFMKQNAEKFNENALRECRNVEAGRPRNAGLEGVVNSKVQAGQVGKGRLRLSDRSIQAISDAWQRELGDATGCSSYAELRRAIHAERLCDTSKSSTSDGAV